MIVCVDGTGDSDEATYKKDMATSFCNQIAHQAGGQYMRGPTLTGSEVNAISIEAAAKAMELSGRGQPIYLAGYSRGGCTVIHTAIRLRQRGLRVKAMFLFDAVDMQFSTGTTLTQIIPDNVDYVAHARGERSLGFYARNPVISRFYFINTGRYLAGSGVRHEQKFVGTHGALGGAPFTEVREDRGCVAAVAAWMTKHLQGQGLAVSLT